MSAASIVSYGQSGAPLESFQCSQVSKRPFEEVLTALRGNIEKAGMLVLNEIDPQKAVERFGHSMGGARLLFFFHPNLVVRLLETEWAAIAEVPLKLAAMEMPDNTVAIRWADPAVALGRYGNPGLAAFGQELAATCRKIVDVSLETLAA